MIKYTYNSVLNKHQFVIHEEINGYYISFMYEENREEEIECMLMSNANNYTDEKICEEIVKKLRNKLINYLGRKRINSRAMFPQTSNMPMFEKRFNNLNSKYVSDNALTLPSWPGMKKNHIKKVCIEITKFLRNNN